MRRRVCHLPFCFGFKYSVLLHQKCKATIRNTMHVFEMPFAKVSTLLPTICDLLCY
jgi:hypothetical protein